MEHVQNLGQTQIYNNPPINLHISFRDPTTTHVPTDLTTLNISSKNATRFLTFPTNNFPLAYSTDALQSSNTRSFTHGFSLPYTSSFSDMIATELCTAQDSISNGVNEATSEPAFASCFLSFAKVGFFVDDVLDPRVFKQPRFLVMICVCGHPYT